MRVHQQAVTGLRTIIQVDKQFSYSIGPKSFTINYKPAVHEGDSNNLRSIEVHNMDIPVLRQILTEIGRALPSSAGPKVGSRRIRQTTKGIVWEEEPSPTE